MSRVIPRMKRLWILVGVVMVGLVASHFTPLPMPSLAFSPPGTFTIITVTLSPARQVSLVVAVLACALTDLIMRRDGHLRGASLARTAPFWVLPALWVFVLFSIYDRAAGPWQHILGLFVAGGLTGFLTLAQLRAHNPEAPWSGPARLVLNAIAYALALGAYYMAHAVPARNLVAMPIIALTSALLALEVLEHAQSSARRIWGSAALVGLMMAEVAWALGPGVYAPAQSAFLLLLVFYTMTGILQQHFWGRLQSRVAVEFAAVAVLALVLLRVAF